MRDTGRHEGPEILLVNAHQLIADALAGILSEQGLSVIGTATNMAELRLTLSRGTPDVIVLDSSLEHQLDGRAAEDIRETAGTTQLVFLDEEKHRLPRGPEPLLPNTTRLSKGSSLQSLADTIRRIHAGEGMTAAPRRQERRHRAGRYSVMAALTARELEILSLLAGGLGSDDIASRLAIRPNTVRSHVQSILAKLGVHSRLEALGWAFKQGLFDWKAVPEGPVGRPT